MLLAVNQGVGVVSGDLKAVAVSDGIAGAGLHTIATEDAPVVINVVDLGVTLRGADALLAGIFGRLNVNAIRRAGRGAEKAGNAFFKPVLVASQNVEAAIAVFKMNRLVRVVLRHRGLKHGLKSDGKALGQSRSGIRDFSKYVRHSPSELSIADASWRVNRR